jgi:hypothetical protein
MQIFLNATHCKGTCVEYELKPAILDNLHSLLTHYPAYVKISI